MQVLPIFLPEDGNRSSSRNVALYCSLGQQAMNGFVALSFVLSVQNRYVTVGLRLLGSDCEKTRLSALVSRVPGYRSRGPSSIPSDTRFSEH
jgi:hypothetical protein